MTAYFALIVLNVVMEIVILVPFGSFLVHKSAFNLIEVLLCVTVIRCPGAKIRHALPTRYVILLQEDVF